MRRLWADVGIFQFSSTWTKGGSETGNFAKVAASTSAPYHYTTSDSMSVIYKTCVPVYRYSLSSDGDSFSLIESQEFIDIAQGKNMIPILFQMRRVLVT